MHIPVEIILRGIARSGALERYIGEAADRLDRTGGRILTCQVIAEVVRRPKREGAQFAVRLNLTLPGTEFVVSREHGEDVYMALRDAFEAASQQLKDHVHRHGNGGQRLRNGTPSPRS
jgi:ribosome-associated translation inhibitor RaiA